MTVGKESKKYEGDAIKHELFCQKYITCFSVKESAEEVGVSQATGSSWLKKPNIQAKIAQLVAQRSKNIEVTEDWIIKKMVDLVTYGMEEVNDKMRNPMIATRNLENLAKHKGMNGLKGLELEGGNANIKVSFE